LLHRTLNLGILAHVDAGKTTLTERLLYAAGVIDELGSVDDGSTQTDTLVLERQRGITIKSAVVSFAIDDVTVNLIDTPGHPDFIAEVERVLSVLDGAVLVISAVEGVQAQTSLLMRALQRLHVPTLIFVNKIDRLGAEPERVVLGIAERLTPSIVPMGATRAALAEVLTANDDALLAAYVDDEGSLSYDRLQAELAAQTKGALVHPVFFGSAMTGAGVETLMSGIAELLPSTDGGGDGPVTGSVFKIERGPAGEKIAFVRMFSGTVRTRDRVQFGRDSEGKVTAINVFERGSAAKSGAVAAGQIAKLWGLGEVQIGDAIGRGRSAQEHHFAPPTLETAVVPSRPDDKGALHVALSQLAEQDPLIRVRQDDSRQELYVSLYGEVQKEVIQATLAADFGIDVAFRETTTICIERPIGTGRALEKAPRPFLATVGLRVEPAAANSGVEYRLEVDPGSLPLSFHKAVEDTVHETLQQGLYGWQVTDCIVTMTHSVRLRHFATSTPAEHRNLTPLVLMRALKQAGTVVCEPIHRFRLQAPADTLGPLLPVLARLGAVPELPSQSGSSFTLEGAIPAARVHELRLRLQRLSRGEGVLECTFDRYEAVRGPTPTRPRWDHNPLNREEYLLHVARRV
jgi:ribosomal protection tetracycline resistance protein